MKIEMRSIDQIKPFENNPRKNDSAVEAVGRSIKEFGFKQPIVVDTENVIVVGHTRWKAAQKIGLAKVPVHVASDLTPEQACAYRIADNQTNNLSEWDDDLLVAEIAGLQSIDYDISLLGFSDEELNELLAPPINVGLCDPDDVPSPPDEATTQRGDIWVLGEHRLMCGDSASTEDVDRLLAGAQIQLCNTDPPYNVNVEPRSNNALAAGSRALPAVAKSKAHLQGFDDARTGRPKATTSKLRAKDRVLANDFMSKEAFDKVLLAWFGNISRALVPGGAFYVWGGYANWANYCRALESCGLYFAQGITWVNARSAMAKANT
jgi:ParB-like chromosome segregation protein Spo0J